MESMSPSLADKRNAPRRRWFQFSVRGLLALTVVVAVAALLYAKRDRDLADATAAEYVQIADPTYSDDGALIGLNFCKWRVSTVGGSKYVRAGDADLADLPRLRQLKQITLCGSQVTDEALRIVCQIDGLEYLVSEHAQVTDEGLRHIGRLRSLRVLDLTGARITDAGLAHIAHLPQLATLRLDDTAITDRAVSHLRSMPALSRLSLSRTFISDLGFVYLCDFQNLTALYLLETQVTEEEVDRIGSATPKLSIMASPRRDR